MAKKEETTVDQEDTEKDLESDTEDEEAESGTDEGDTVDESEQDDEDEHSEKNETAEEKLARVQAKANKYRRLLKNAQKNSKSNSSSSVQRQPTSPAVDVDERILKSQGMDNDLLKQLKDVARLRNVGLIEAQSDPLFTGIKDQYEKDKKQKAASLPASRGSGTTKPKKTLSTPGLTKEEHKALMRESA